MVSRIESIYSSNDLKKNQMKKTPIEGVAAAEIGLFIGSQPPKLGTARYTVITGTTKERSS